MGYGDVGDAKYGLVVVARYPLFDKGKLEDKSSASEMGIHNYDRYFHFTGARAVKGRATIYTTGRSDAEVSCYFFIFFAVMLYHG